MLTLLASPLVGPSTWSATTEEVSVRGRNVCVVDLRAVVTPDGPDLDVAEARVRAAIGDAERPVFVPHSGAGPLTPALLARFPEAAGAVFVDAGLPTPGAERVPLAPAAFLAHLRSLADDDGMLPPWSSWWGDDVMSEVVPDGRVRDRLVSEMRSLPLGYFTASVEVPQGWPSTHGAYLAFGAEAYAEDVERARALGWPVRVVEGAGHLHAAVEPAAVASAILDLAETLDV